MKTNTKPWSEMSEDEWVEERKRIQHVINIHYQK